MEEIINSVMQSPENTNPNVLRSQLQSVGGGSGGGGALVVNVTADSSTGKLVCDKTAAEMFTAYQTGVVLLRATDVVTEMFTVVGVATDESAYYTFICYAVGSALTFTATSGDSYPQATMG